MKKLLLALFSLVALTAFADGPNSALIGQTVTLTATADGTQPFSYQWQKDGAPIAGATASTLTKANLQLADTGTYSVVISNSAGSTAPSLVFTVTAPVLPPKNGGIDSFVH